MDTNRQKLWNCLTIVAEELYSLAEKQLRIRHGEPWQDYARKSLPDPQSSLKDAAALIRIVIDKQLIAPRERNYLFEIRDIRNRLAHMEAFDARDADRAMDTIRRFLVGIGSSRVVELSELRNAAPVPQVQIPTVKIDAVGTKSLVEVGEAGIARGVRLFRYLAAQANRGNSVGISYGDFIAFLHAEESFHAVAGRKYLPSDSSHVIELAWKVTDASGGRIEVSGGGKRINAGMDTFIWSSSSPYDRTARAWANPKCTLPYSPQEWRAVFPDGQRRLVKIEALERIP